MLSTGQAKSHPLWVQPARPVCRWLVVRAKDRIHHPYGLFPSTIKVLKNVLTARGRLAQRFKQLDLPQTQTKLLFLLWTSLV